MYPWKVKSLVHGRTHLAPGADLLATQVQGQGRWGRQHRRMVLVRAGNEAAGWVGVSVVLKETHKRQ